MTTQFSSDCDFVIAASFNLKIERGTNKICVTLFAFKDYMPAPPTDEEEDKEAADDKEIEAEKKLNFSYVECLLFTFHQLGRQVRAHF